MKTRQEIVIKAIAYSESIGNEDGTSAYDYVMGYNQCQKDMANEIQSLIDGYNYDIWERKQNEGEQYYNQKFNK